MNRTMKAILALGLMVFVCSFSFTTSTDFQQDLGRHIKLGTIIRQTGSVPHTNLFSYTAPQFPFINHHWMPEVMYSWLYTTAGIGSLIALKTITIAAAVAVLLAVLRSRAGYAAAAGFLLVPLLVERSDIRPEVFGFFFFAVLTALLVAYPRAGRWHFIIPLIMLAWINTHITFIFGVGLMGLLVIKSFLLKRRDRKLYLSIAAGFAVLLINPNGIAGAIYPLRIFGNYGYTIVENQNLFFLAGLMTDPIIKYVFMLTPVIVAAAGFSFYKRRHTEGILAITFLVMTYSQLRHIPFLVFAAMPSVTMFVEEAGRRIKRREIRQLAPIMLFLCMIAASGIFLSGWYYRTFDQPKHFGIGMTESGKKAADFVLKHDLPPRMFNNFDIGGYAIYRLYPRYSVFVDNRPEAYPKEFMQNTYIAMQYDAALRKQVFRRYGIHTIFFSHTDQTPWAASFVQAILTDRSWKLIYLDSSTMVLSDQTDLADVRGDTDRLTRLIRSADSWIDLLDLTNILQVLGRTDLAKSAFTKAASLNPDSCAVEKNRAYQMEASGLSNPQAVRSQYWYCF